jgi:hypothetical protein
VAANIEALGMPVFWSISTNLILGFGLGLRVLLLGRRELETELKPE